MNTKNDLGGIIRLCVLWEATTTRQPCHTNLLPVTSPSTQHLNLTSAPVIIALGAIPMPAHTLSVRLDSSRQMDGPANASAAAHSATHICASASHPKVRLSDHAGQDSHYVCALRGRQQGTRDMFFVQGVPLHMHSIAKLSFPRRS